MTRTRRQAITKPWRRHGPCSYCLDGRLHTHRGRLHWLLSDLRSYFHPQTRILELLADHPTSEYTFSELAQRTGLRESALNRGLRALTRQSVVLARIQGGTYPNLVYYQLSTEGALQFATPRLPTLNFPGPYKVDDILDEELGRKDE